MSNAPFSDYPPFLASQQALARYIRNPAQAVGDASWPISRLQTYADLVYNTVQDLLARFFPVLKEVVSAQDWQQMVRDFIGRHQSQSPYFLELAQEFLDYLEQERDGSNDPPFLLELAHYEWVELALDVSDMQNPDTGFDPDGDLLEYPICLSPLICSLAYRFPVHRICRDFQPQQPPEQASFLLVYRDRTDKVRFLELNALSARLLSLIEQQPAACGEQLLQQLAAETGLSAEQLRVNGAQTLQQWREQGIILGTFRSVADA